MASSRVRAVSLERAPKSETGRQQDTPALPLIPLRAKPSVPAVVLPQRPAVDAQQRRGDIELPQPDAARPRERSRPAPDLTVPTRTPQDPIKQRPSRLVVEQPRRPSGRLMAVAGLAVVVAVATVTYATTHSDRSPSSPRPGAALAPTTSAAQSSAAATPSASTTPDSSTAATAGSIRAATNWVSTNLARSTPLAAQGAIGTQLSARGFSAVGEASARTAYLIGDPTTLRAQAGDPVYGRSVVVARFGSGASAVQVRSVLSVQSDRVQAVLASDRANRLLAGTALASNPQLSANGDVRAVIRTGDLDLRAATFLALVASDIRVRLVAVPLDSAESAVSRPHRVLVIAASGAAATAVRDAARALPADYAPAGIGTGASGSIVLTWSPSAQPVASVS